MMNRLKKYAACWLSFVLLAGVLGCGAWAASVEEMAAALLAAEKTGAPTPTMSKQFGPADNQTGYQVQDAYVAIRLETEKIAGYKGAMTAAPLMKKFSTTEPASGVLFASGDMPEGAVITLDRKGIMLEEEIGFRFGKTISAPLKDAAELKTYVSTIFPAIEVPLVAFETLDGVIAFDMIAANVGSWAYILGKEMPLDDRDLNAVHMTMTCDGEVFNTGTGADALGDQWEALLWIVNNVVSSGRPIEAGQFIISGAMGAMKPARPGTYAADFGSFGKIEFEVKAQ